MSSTATSSATTGGIGCSLGKHAPRFGTLGAGVGVDIASVAEGGVCHPRWAPNIVVSTLVTNSYTLSVAHTRLTVTSAGTIAPSGHSATAVAGTAHGISLINLGAIVGGAGIYRSSRDGGAGGGGVSLVAGRVTNTGTITGGAGAIAGSGDGRAGGTGGVGVSLGSGCLRNSGRITGGAGGASSTNYYSTGGAGGAGVSIAGGSLTNLANGMITGGNGAMSADPGNGLAGAGGAGVILSGATVTNGGGIYGGTGGGADYNAGAGGAGAYVNSGVLTNTGTIIGGTGGGAYNAGFGGVGVFLNGGTLINAGTIAGGTSGYDVGNAGFPNAGDAVRFGTQAATLVVDPGAVFAYKSPYYTTLRPYGGIVAANSAVNDVLELSGTTGGTLSGLGTQFTGFTTIAESAGATWTLVGVNTVGAPGISLGSRSTLTNAGTLSGTILAAGTGAVVTNLGSLAARATVGVSLANGGTFTNGAYTVGTGARVTASTGALGSGQASYVFNFGTIIATVGIDLAAGGQGVNGSTLVTSALIQATSIGLEATTASAHLANDGTVLATGSAGIGAMLAAGGKIANGFFHVGSALLSGSRYGALADGGKSLVVNYGTIIGGIGVVFGTGNTSGTLTNGGTITGTGGTAVELIQGADTVAITPGAVFNGAVVATGAGDVISLGSGAMTGTLTGLGSQFTGFTAVDVSQGATWALGGNAAGASTISIGASAVLDATRQLAVSAVRIPRRSGVGAGLSRLCEFGVLGIRGGRPD